MLIPDFSWGNKKEYLKRMTDKLLYTRYFALNYTFFSIKYKWSNESDPSTIIFNSLEMLYRKVREMIGECELE